MTPDRRAIYASRQYRAQPLRRRELLPRAPGQGGAGPRERRAHQGGPAARRSDPRRHRLFPRRQDHVRGRVGGGSLGARQERRGRAPRRHSGARRLLRRPWHRTFSRQRVPPARHPRRRDAAHSRRHSGARHPRAAAAGRAGSRREAERDGAGRRRRRQRQEHVDREHDRAPQRDALAPHRHGRGPDRVRPRRPSVEHQSARGRDRHGKLRLRASRRPSPGSGRHLRGRDSRRGDDGDRASAPPRPGTSSSPRCTRPTRFARSTACSP